MLNYCHDIFIARVHVSMICEQSDEKIRKSPMLYSSASSFLIIYSILKACISTKYQTMIMSLYDYPSSEMTSFLLSFFYSFAIFIGYPSNNSQLKSANRYVHTNVTKVGAKECLNFLENDELF